MSASEPAPLVVVGDALLDRDLEGRVERLSPEAPVPVVDDPTERSRPGGAGLAAAFAAADGERPVRLVTALADDSAARELRERLRETAVEVIDLGLVGPTPEKVRVRGGGRTLVRIDHGGEGGPVESANPRALESAREAIAGAGAVLVSDYGRGVAGVAELRASLAELATGTPLVWDPHPRGAEPIAGTLLVTPNADEAAHFAAGEGSGVGAATRRAAELARRWKAAYVCVTRGGHGALMADVHGPPLVVSASAASAAGDVCGAGDRFASRLAMLLAAGELPSAAVAGAVDAASQLVADGGATRATLGAAPEAAAFTPNGVVHDRERGPSEPRPESDAGKRRVHGAGRAAPSSRGDRAGAFGESAAHALAERVRARGGTVVATGGCFDLLHAGHVSVLRAARALGDCLIVLLNSDASMRRLKGLDRPLVGEGDRAAVLGALDAVDAVVVFDEDTPAEVLGRLRPDLFAKGGDYSGRELPEAAALERHGGQAVVLPYVAGRSTTRLIEEVALRGAG